MISLWIFWIIVALTLLIVELVTGTIICLCLSVAAAVSIIPAVLDVPLVWQIVIFLVASVLAMVFLRPMMKRLGNDKHSREYRTNMDALIGRTGKVTHEITNLFDDGGRVQIDGDSWLAYTDDPNIPIHRGEQVVVEAYDSLVLKVRRRP